MKPSVLKGFRFSSVFFPGVQIFADVTPGQDEVRVHGGGAKASECLVLRASVSH